MKWIRNWNSYNEDVYHDIDNIYRSYDPNKKNDHKPNKIPDHVNITSSQTEPEVDSIDSVDKVSELLPINILSAINKGGIKEIIFSYQNKVYKWVSSKGLFDEDGQVSNSEIENTINQKLNSINFIDII